MLSENSSNSDIEHVTPNSTIPDSKHEDVVKEIGSVEIIWLFNLRQTSRAEPTLLRKHVSTKAANTITIRNAGNHS